MLLKKQLEDNSPFVVHNSRLAMVQIDKSTGQSAPQHTTSDSQPPRLTDVFSRSCSIDISACEDKPAVFESLIDGLAREHRIKPRLRDNVVKELLENEQLGTSAIGRGLAFPHVRTSAVDLFAGAIGIAADGMDLRSLDGLPTKVVMLLVSPWDLRNDHLSLLSRLVSMMQEKAVQLRMDHEITADDIWHYLEDFDSRSATDPT